MYVIQKVTSIEEFNHYKINKTKSQHEVYVF